MRTLPFGLHFKRGLPKRSVNGNIFPPTASRDHEAERLAYDRKPTAPQRGGMTPSARVQVMKDQRRQEYARNDHRTDRAPGEHGDQAGHPRKSRKYDIDRRQQHVALMMDRPVPVGERTADEQREQSDRDEGENQKLFAGHGRGARRDGAGNRNDNA